MDEDGLAPLTAAQRTYDKYFVSDEQKPSNSQDNAFGRGYASGRGQPIPSRWKLLGGSRSMSGSGKTTKKKAGPTSKAEESCSGS